MIQETLSHIAKELNQYLKDKLAIKEDKVMVSPVINLDGSLITEENKILLTFINLQEDTFRHNSIPHNAPDPILLSYTILISSYFNSSNYSEGLKFLTMVKQFLFNKGFFDSSNTSDFPIGVNRITIYMETVSFETLHHIWKMLGTNYRPCIVYIVRINGV